LARFKRYELLSSLIDQAGVAESFDLVAFVFMPEHLHLLVYPRPTQPAFGTYLARIKRPFSGLVKEEWSKTRPELVDELTIPERPGKFSFRFWQEGPGFDRKLFSREAVLASIDYLHSNPMRRGLCQRAIDWPWSSARYYLAEPPRQQFPGLPFIHGLPDSLD